MTEKGVRIDYRTVNDAVRILWGGLGIPDYDWDTFDKLWRYLEEERHEFISGSGLQSKWADIVSAYRAKDPSKVKNP